MSSTHSRSKIIELLSQRVVKDFSLLTQEEMCEFVALTRNLEDEVASMGGHTDIDYTTQVEQILTTIEPYVQDEISLLTVNDLINAYVGFSHTHVSRPFQIINLLEARLINLAHGQKINFHDATEILYEFSQRQIGSKVLIETLINMVETISAEKFEKFEDNEVLSVDKDIGFKLIVALDTVQSE